MDIKALRHETKHVEWKPLLLLMHLVISFFNKIFTENPIPLTGKERFLLILLELSSVINLHLFNWFYTLTRELWFSGLFFSVRRLPSRQWSFPDLEFCSVKWGY